VLTFFAAPRLEAALVFFAVGAFVFETEVFLVCVALFDAGFALFVDLLLGAEAFVAVALVVLLAEAFVVLFVEAFVVLFALVVAGFFVEMAFLGATAVFGLAAGFG
jgi:hypothetical protein